MTKYASQAYKHLQKGAFTDYVDKISTIIDHLNDICDRISVLI